MTRSSSRGDGNPFVGLRAVPSPEDSPEDLGAQGRGQESPGGRVVIAIDPGRTRTGVAVRYCNLQRTQTISFEPWWAVAWVQSMLNHGHSEYEIVIERWVPYPGAMAGNAWQQLTEVLTSGAIEWMCRQAEVRYTYQPTSILVPTYARATAEGYEWKYTNRDERAAETHLVYYLDNNPGE